MKDSLIRQMLQVYYDWDRIEPGGIIDFDLVGERNAFIPKYETHEEIVHTFKNVKKELLRTVALPTAEDRFILAKINGSLAYLEALGAKQLPIRTYLKRTLCISPRIFSRTTIKQYFLQLIAAYHVLGIRYEKNNLEQYIQTNQIDRKRIMETFVAARDRILPQVMDWLGIHVPLDYVTEFVDKDVYWMNWISTRSDGKILLQYNINTRHKWTIGSAEYLVLHEVCGHFLQVSSWKNQIKKGSVNPVIGLTTTFTCEQISLEGIAESLWYFLPFDPLSQAGRIAVLQDHLYCMVMNNVHIMANEGVSFDTLYEFIVSYLPRMKREEVEKIVKEKTTNPLLRSYQFSYGYGLHGMKSIALSLSKQNKKRFLRNNYLSVMTPKDIQVFAARLR